jgi:RNA polymerase sigma factor (sigma-70 family)
MNVETRLSGVIRGLAVGPDGAPADAELLTRYASRGDQAAFATLVQRYGALVLGVARRQLADRQQAEDVFQATFLALARSAGRLRADGVLANWLYTVAARQARKARARVLRRAALERTAPSPRPVRPDPLAAVSGRELVQAIDDELARLPDRYRLPVLLCFVLGLSREEAAAQLGWSAGSLKGRLERGRRRLAARLAARGLAPAVALLGPLAAVIVPPDLLATAAALGMAPWAGSIPAPIAQMAGASPRRFPLLAGLAGSLLVVGLVGWAIASTGQAPETPRRPDSPQAAEGPQSANRADPLPDGAMLRFGTSRFRQGPAISRLTVSADGTLAVATSGGHVHGAVRGFDLTDGRALYAIADAGFDVQAVGLSPDGRTLATKSGNSIGLYESRTGKPVRTIHLADTGGGTITEWITWAPDGKFVALTQGDSHAVVLVDVDRGVVARTFKHNNVVYAAAFSPDGTRLAAGGYDSERDGYVTRLWEVATGKELWRFTHPEGGLRAVEFSPDGKVIAAGGDGGWARLWDADSGKELKKLPKAGYRVRSVAFAPDGNTLAVAGDRVHLVDTKTFADRLQIDRQAVGLRFSNDGAVLTGAVAGAVYRWDASTGKALTPRSAGDSPVDQVLVTPDARKLVTRGQDGDARLWDAVTGTDLRPIAGNWQRGMALSPDGRFLVWPVADEKTQFKDPKRPNAIHTGSRLRLYDLWADTFVDRFGPFEGDAQELFFTPDGKSLVTVDHRDGMVRVWDFATGKERRKFRVVREAEATRDYLVWNSVLSPDGGTLVVTYQPAGFGAFSEFVARLFDVATGRETHELTGCYYYIAVAFSPDSRLVVTGTQALNRFAQEQLKRPPNQVFVWDAATGKRVAALPDGLPAGAVAAAFSADGRTLATAVPDGLIRLWETATWTVRCEYRGHRDRVTALAFATDGRLFSGGNDTTALAWDPRPAKSAGTIEVAWDGLTNSDSSVAFKAQGQLLAAPAEAVKYLAARLKPVAVVDPKHLATLIADLDSPTFASREKASKVLAEVSRPALAALRDAARAGGSAEARRRATDLVERIEAGKMSAGELRAVRAVDVLAWIRSGEARELLTRLAAGETEAHLTAAAADALKRLHVRDSAK